MPKCCLYCRVDGASTESNRLAMNQQLTALRSLAGQLGFSISAEMLQYESGLDANRQSIRTLIRDARHGVYDRVLVMNGDRLARDAEGLAAIGEKLTAAGVRVYCPDGEIDLAPRLFSWLFPCGNNGTDHVIGKSSRPTSLPRPKKMRYNKRTTYTRPGKSVIPAGRRCCHEFIRGKEK